MGPGVTCFYVSGVQPALKEHVHSAGHQSMVCLENSWTLNDQTAHRVQHMICCWGTRAVMLWARLSAKAVFKLQIELYSVLAQFNSNVCV